MKFSKKIAWFSVLGCVLLVAVLAVRGTWKAKNQKERQTTALDEASDAEMKLTDMEYTEMERGRRAWTLKAEEAKYYQDDQKTALSRVRLQFFLQDGEEIQLESSQGVLHAGSKDIELSGQVHAVFPNGYEMSSEKATYHHKQSLISSETSILVTGPDLSLKGRHWKYDIPARRASLEGQVQATLALTPDK